MKIYNGEKAIISLTSWKARINTVAKTLYSLIEKCPGFHIVLVLSEEEFPKKEEELPENLRLFIDNDLIEVLWVYKNYKVSKKLYSCCKYTDIPVIVTDDDVIVVRPFAEELYEKWKENKTAFISYNKSTVNPPYICTACSLIPPIVNPFIAKKFHNNSISLTHEDEFLRNYAHENKIEVIGLHDHFPFHFHDEIKPITGSKSIKLWQKWERFN